MNKEFELDGIGKRMPYRVPEGFFQELTATVGAALETRVAGDAPDFGANQGPLVMPRERKQRRRAVWFGVGAISAIAASVALVLVFTSQAWQYREVDRSFTALDSSDQSYLLEVYENDVFLELL